MVTWLDVCEQRIKQFILEQQLWIKLKRTIIACLVYGIIQGGVHILGAFSQWVGNMGGEMIYFVYSLMHTEFDRAWLSWWMNFYFPAILFYWHDHRPGLLVFTALSPMVAPLLQKEDMKWFLSSTLFDFLTKGIDEAKWVTSGWCSPVGCMLEPGRCMHFVYHCASCLHGSACLCKLNQFISTGICVLWSATAVKTCCLWQWLLVSQCLWGRVCVLCKMVSAM